MHLISARNLKLAVSQYPDLEENINIICKNIQDVSWSHLLELQDVYPSAEAIKIELLRTSTALNYKFGLIAQVI
jgi:mRNA-degrading endonuclease HigB of HigAB toxin-antitoxin module